MLSDAEVHTVFDRIAKAMPVAGEAPVRHPKLNRDAFRAVAACILSAQSLDRNTAKAADQLFALADTPAGLLTLDDEALVAAIRPAGLYNTKARNLRKMAAALLSEHGGIVPDTREGLMSLPGVGRKCADIVLRFTYDQPVVAVDTHVHRVANRLGLASGKTEAQTAARLEPRVPGPHAMDGHMLLIRFGKRVCTARAPKCPACLLNDLCEAYLEGRVRPAPSVAGEVQP